MHNAAAFYRPPQNQTALFRKSRTDGVIVRGLIVQDDIEQGLVHADAAAVVVLIVNLIAGRRRLL